MKTVSKTLFAATAGLAVVVASAAPAMAQDRYRDRGHDDHIDAGDVIAGALIIGGIAAVAGAVNNDRGGYNDRDRNYRDDDYRNGGDYRDGGYRDDNRGGGYRNGSWHDNDYSRDRDYRGRGYGDWYSYNAGGRGSRNGNVDRAVERCVQAAESEAERWGGGRADVTQIRDIDRDRSGFLVRDTIAVRSYNSRNRSWGGNWGNYRRGGRNNGFDTGTFTCDFSRGRVVDIDFGGLRNL
jgi:hypothetical protein